MSTNIKKNILIEVNPYIDVLLRMLLCIQTINCSAERPFTTPKKVSELF